MDLLTKFASIEIRSDTRISEADRAFCRAHQAAYDNARETLQELEFFWEDMLRQQQEALAPIDASSGTGTYLTAYGKLDLSGDGIRQQRRSLHPTFINKLVSYFNETYHLAIQGDDIKESLLPPKPSYGTAQDHKQQTKEYTAALDSLTLHYTQVLDLLFLQTGGRELAEHAVFELREKCRRAAWNSVSNRAAFTLKKATLQLDFACSCRDYCRALNSWELHSKTLDILRGIAHFEAEGFSGIPDSLTQVLQKGGADDNAFDFSGCGKVQSMKLYKNRRVDIRFHTEEYARRFVEEYLGTLPPC